ncbi:hypothetical protein HMPREF9370_0807 [Neisseria wadsworthii 9715]|uniref:Uncharacterized protein n=1 Tax=Neisseria wadsworthii 9715 TaxID=1030841 RepID=G4CNZ8_9NEIS|nr:hypothetical protein HMPREF9370_0807 [Neisseria wadsworthii 9715]
MGWIGLSEKWVCCTFTFRQALIWGNFYPLSGVLGTDSGSRFRAVC